MKKPEPFSIPSLADADAEYGALAAKFLALSLEQSEVKAEADALEADIRTRKGPAIRPAIAELIGETVDTSLLDRPRRLAVLRQRVADLEAAAEYIRRLRDDRRGIASVAACGLVKQEYGHRISALVAALETAKAAYDHADEILDVLEREDVQIGYMQPTRSPFFAGKENGMSRLIADARSAGHVA